MICHIEAKAGEHIEGFIKRTITVANAAEQPIIAKFNSLEFTVCMNHEDQLLEQYCQALEKRNKPETHLKPSRAVCEQFLSIGLGWDHNRIAQYFESQEWKTFANETINI